MVTVQLGISSMTATFGTGCGLSSGPLRSASPGAGHLQRAAWQLPRALHRREAVGDITLFIAATLHRWIGLLRSEIRARPRRLRRWDTSGGVFSAPPTASRRPLLGDAFRRAVARVCCVSADPARLGGPTNASSLDPIALSRRDRGPGRGAGPPDGRLAGRRERPRLHALLPPGRDRPGERRPAPTGLDVPHRRA